MAHRCYLKYSYRCTFPLSSLALNSPYTEDPTGGLGLHLCILLRVGPVNLPDLEPVKQGDVAGHELPPGQRRRPVCLKLNV